jgi:hypothetical protein
MPEQEKEKGVIYADVWRNMASTDIVDSLELAVRVLKQRGVDDPESVAKLLLIISDIAEMLAEMAQY